MDQSVKKSQPAMLFAAGWLYQNDHRDVQYVPG